MDRAQIHTLEAFLAALLIVGALLFATQATAVTPLSASTANQHIENQHQTVAEDLLRLSASDGSLQEALRYWNASEQRFHNTSDINTTGYTGIPPDDHPLSDQLATALGEGELAYNVELRFETPDGTDEIMMFDMGTPSDHAVTAIRTVTLSTHDTLTAPGEDNVRLDDEEASFWAPDLGSSSSLYNVVEVRITVWRM